MWNQSENQIKITFIRHGATPSNLESKYVGWMEESLSTEGKEQLKSKWKEPPVVDRVFSSPMGRCLETVELIFRDCQPIIIPEWKEINFGDFEGKNYKELSQNPDYQKWIDSNGTLPFPNGEKRNDFIRRTMKGLERCLEQCQKNGWKEIACVVHGGSIMAMGSELTGEDYYSFQIKNGDAYQTVITMKEKDEK